MGDSYGAEPSVQSSAHQGALGAAYAEIGDKALSMSAVGQTETLLLSSGRSAFGAIAAGRGPLINWPSWAENPRRILLDFTCKQSTGGVDGQTD